MNKNNTLLKTKNLFIITFALLLITSCGPSEYQKIPLDKLDSKLKRTGSKVVKDIITSINHKDGARHLLDMDYITPLVHARITTNTEMYNESFQMTSLLIGKVTKYSLFQVLDKGVIKTMRYKLTTDTNTMKFIELKVDINSNYGLADFYLYITSKDDLLKRENIFPKAVK